MDNMIVFSVYEVNHHLRQVLESSIEPLYVRGEVSNFTHHSSGHMYFNLKDESATLRCTFFRNVNQRLDFRPQDGQSVICFGSITLFEKGGSYNLNVTTMMPAGEGEIQARIEALKKKLKTEGLFEQAHKKALPPYPEKIGIITSPTGAALQDIQSVLSRRYPVQAYVFPALVQGKDAPPTLIRGIEYFNESMQVDLIILTRGGGSQEDLFCFNDEALAHAIFASKTPIISAVGHEIDFSISDFVADFRAPTPSAAAEIAVPNKDDLKIHLNGIKQRLQLTLQGEINVNKRRLSENASALSHYHPQRLWQEYQQRLDFAILSLKNLRHIGRDSQIALERISSRLQSAYEFRLRRSLDQSKQNLATLEYKLKNSAELLINSKFQEFSAQEGIFTQLAPEKMLKKGWILAQKDGKSIRSIDEVNAGDILELLLVDGKINAEVRDKK